jgi:hypothetical protein
MGTKKEVRVLLCKNCDQCGTRMECSYCARNPKRRKFKKRGDRATGKESRKGAWPT